MSNFYNLYKEKILWDFIKHFSLKSCMAVPKLIKIIINIGCGSIFNDKKKMNSAFLDLILISNQKPILIKSKKSISNFKIRKGNNIAIKVTLRKFFMYEFFYKLINIYIPRIKDFNGFKDSSFDNFGNYSFGVKDQMIFTELYSIINFIKGLNINLIINSNNINKSKFLLKSFNFPFIN